MQPTTEPPKEEAKQPPTVTSPQETIEHKEEDNKYEFEDEETKDNIIKIFEIFEEKSQTLAPTKDIQTEAITQPLPTERKMKYAKLQTLLRALDQVPSVADLEVYKKEFAKEEKAGENIVELITLHDIFMIMMRRLKKTDTIEELTKALQLFAVDEEKEKIPNEQFRHALSKLGLKFDPKLIEDIIEKADSNNDGYVEISSFASLLMGEKKKGKRGGKGGKKKKSAKGKK